jgi:hypothetical protein
MERGVGESVYRRIDFKPSLKSFRSVLEKEYTAETYSNLDSLPVCGPTTSPIYYCCCVLANFRIPVAHSICATTIIASTTYVRHFTMKAKLKNLREKFSLGRSNRVSILIHARRWYLSTWERSVVFYHRVRARCSGIEGAGPWTRSSPRVSILPHLPAIALKFPVKHRRCARSQRPPGNVLDR